ncbi:MAG: hypothetical protein RLZZ488_1355 [Pseudomonadota bacterium]
MSQYPQLHLTNDSFIYACQSEFAARTKKDGSFNSHLRYEEFLTSSFSRPANPTMKDVARLFTAIAKHQTQATAQFRRNEPINLETVSYFTCAIATLFADLESACKELFGTGLPIIPETPPEYSTEAPIATSLLNARSTYLSQGQSGDSEPAVFEAFPRSEFPNLTAEQQAQLWSCELWDLIADALHSSLGEYADAAMGFAYWKYQEVPQKPDIDWRVRPPVGEAYAKAFKPLLRKHSDRGDRSFDKRDRFDRKDRGDRPDRGERTDKHERGGRGERPAHTGEASAGEQPKTGHETRKPRSESGAPQRDGLPTSAQARPERSEHTRQPRGERRGEQSDRPRGGREARTPNTGPQSSEQQLNEALEEVRQAITSLSKNPAMGEIQLKPNNSFIRRQQHSLAVELGFDTESRGEGRDRGVVIRTAQV